jgi:hypothetical protein
MGSFEVAVARSARSRSSGLHVCRRGRGSAGRGWARGDPVHDYTNVSPSAGPLIRWAVARKPTPVADPSPGMSRYDVGAGDRYAGTMSVLLPAGHVEAIDATVFEGSEVSHLDVVAGSDAPQSDWLTVLDPAVDHSKAAHVVRLSPTDGNMLEGDAIGALLQSDDGAYAALFGAGRRVDDGRRDELPAANDANPERRRRPSARRDLHGDHDRRSRRRRRDAGARTWSAGKPRRRPELHDPLINREPATEQIAGCAAAHPSRHSVTRRIDRQLLRDQAPELSGGTPPHGYGHTVATPRCGRWRYAAQGHPLASHLLGVCACTSCPEAHPAICWTPR